MSEREREAAAEVEAEAPAGTKDGPPATLRLPWLRIREPVALWQRWGLGVLPIAALLGVWWLVTAGATAEARLISPTILPSPLEVARSFGSLWFERALTRNLFVSLYRVAAGFAVGVAFAFPLASFSFSISISAKIFSSSSSSLSL